MVTLGENIYPRNLVTLVHFFSLKSFQWIAGDYIFGEKELKIHQKGKFTLIFYRFNLAFGGY
jgi:hypothetical protein